MRTNRLRVWIDVLFIDQLSSDIAGNLVVAERVPRPRRRGGRARVRVSVRVRARGAVVRACLTHVCLSVVLNVSVCLTFIIASSLSLALSLSLTVRLSALDDRQTASSQLRIRYAALMQERGRCERVGPTHWDRGSPAGLPRIPVIRRGFESWLGDVRRGLRSEVWSLCCAPCTTSRGRGCLRQWC